MPTIRERLDSWDPEVIYVVGHQRPDTDAIASALGFAWYLSQIEPENDIQAARAGQPGKQALFALKRFELANPLFLAGVAPTFGHAAIRQTSVRPTDGIPAAMMRVAEGDRVIPLVDENNKPAGVVTSLALARAYTAPVNIMYTLAQPSSSLAEQPQMFYSRDKISDHRNSLLRSEIDDFLVISDDGEYVGVATRRRILEPPRARLYLVDHNELGQAVTDAEEAEIIGVLDHHRLGNSPTASPIPFVVDVVGSTSTLVAEHCKTAGLVPPQGLAGMLLSGVLSDTLVFRSPTTTPRDKVIAEWLEGIAGIDRFAYGEELLHAAPGLGTRTVQEILDTDRKSYQMGGHPVSLAQVEVTGFQSLPERRAELLATMEEWRQREGAALFGLMVTDIVTGTSRMLARGDKWVLTTLPFTRVGEGEYDLEEMVSRKKQLVPALSALLDETR